MNIKKNIKQRLEWIDLCKGIAIVLVVIGHMLRGFVSSGMYKEYNNIFSYLDYIIYSFHMQLFFIISGVLYKKGKGIDGIKQYLNFVKKKFIVIMIPYLLFSWIQIIIKLIMGGSVNNKVNYGDFFIVIFKPIEQFWFLYALMIIFIVIGFIDMKLNSEFIRAIIIIGIFIFINSVPFSLGILGVALSNLLYFYFGCLYIKVEKKLYKKNNVILFGLLIYIIMNINFYNKSLDGFIFIIVKVIMALLASLVIISYSEKLQYKRNFIINTLKYFGKYSMSVYLLHIILGSGIRIVLLKLSIDSFIIHISLGLIFSIIVPIIIDKLYRKIKVNLVNKDILFIKL